MKKLFILLLTIPVLFSFKPAEPTKGLDVFKNLVGHSWMLHTVQPRGGPDLITKRIYTYTEGETANVINYKITELNDTTGEFETFGEGTILYNVYDDEIYYSETLYYGALIAGKIIITESGDFTFIGRSMAETDESSYPLQEKYMMVNDKYYNLEIFVTTETIDIKIASGTFTRLD